MISTPQEFLSNFFNKDEHFFIVCLSHAKGEDFKLPQHYLVNSTTFNYLNNRLKWLNNDYSIYFTPSEFYKTEEAIVFNNYNKPRKVKENVKRVKALILDFDEPETSQANLKSLLDYVGIKPTYVLETSPNKFQVCFMFENNDIDKNRFEIVNKTLAIYFKSDTNVCSMEKLFRLPFFVNKKNGFKTRLLEYNFSNKYNFSLFENLISSNEIIKEIAQDVENKGLPKKAKTTAPKTTPQKKAPKVVNMGLEANSNIKNLDKKLVGKYGFLLKRNNYDASVADAIYINFRKNTTNDYDLVWNEILYLRNYFKHPIKRNIDLYYKDRQDLFFDSYGRER